MSSRLCQRGLACQLDCVLHPPCAVVGARVNRSFSRPPAESGRAAFGGRGRRDVDILTFPGGGATLQLWQINRRVAGQTGTGVGAASAASPTPSSSRTRRSSTRTTGCKSSTRCSGVTTSTGCRWWRWPIVSGSAGRVSTWSTPPSRRADSRDCCQDGLARKARARSRRRWRRLYAAIIANALRPASWSWRTRPPSDLASGCTRGPCGDSWRKKNTLRRRGRLVRPSEGFLQAEDTIQQAYETERARCLAGEAVRAPELGLKVVRGQDIPVACWRVTAVQARVPAWTGGRDDHHSRLCRVVAALCWGPNVGEEGRLPCG